MNALDFSREHTDPQAGDCPPLMLDRQRVVRAAAFRRLQHKTQVFLAATDDHFRTRLTHTLEVADLARRLAWKLRLNADLAEAVALAHDLGHPPFGHAGERALARCLEGHGGFEHNRQTLRVVELLEHPYPDFRGLNLTRVVRECLAKHTTPFDRPGQHPLQDGRPAPAEGRVVDLADRLTYLLHDVQDGLYAGLLTPTLLARSALWRWAYLGSDSAPRDRTVGPSPPALAQTHRDDRQSPAGAPLVWRGYLRPTIDRIQQLVLTDVTLAPSGSSNAAPQLSADLGRQLDELERILQEHVYRSPALRAADEQAENILTAVFNAYVASPERLPPRFQKRIAEHGLRQTVTDYVAGMTDRYCRKMHEASVAGVQAATGSLLTAGPRELTTGD